MTSTKTKFSIWQRSKIKYLYFWHKYKIRILIGAALFVFLAAFFWQSIFISIEPGHAAVLWKRFFNGTVLNRTYGEGLHIIWPWDKMYDYEVRIQERHESIRILSKAGLYVDMNISYRFFPDFFALPYLHTRWGPLYIEKFVMPEAKSAAITVIGNYPPKKLYSMDMYAVQSMIRKILEEQFLDSNIMIQDFVITQLSLPQKIKDAIESKLAQQQLLEEYNYRVAIEGMEKERRRIEGEGIKTFEELSGISILKWKGLSVTQELAKSPNSKIIVIGTGPSGLPIILNTDK